VDNYEQPQSTEKAGQTQEQLEGLDDHNVEPANEHDANEQEADEFDYNREPPLDSATTTANRRRSKYVFMTLCFLLALLLFYRYLTNSATGDWFPLVGAIVLTIMGVIFLRSPDSPPGSPPAPEQTQTPEQEAEKKLSPFEELVKEALATIPEEFHQQMENILVHVEYEPDAETLQRVGVKEGHTLLGLYEGVPLTAYGRHYAPYPETITIYQRPIEDYCRHNPTRIREQVRATVLHEVAHHFGMGHAEMPIWVK
jgi:predicted Zn-dependent protease with MMP-like domain